jgi:hypothetical protein
MITASKMMIKPGTVKHYKLYLHKNPISVTRVNGQACPWVLGLDYIRNWRRDGTGYFEIKSCF